MEHCFVENHWDTHFDGANNAVVIILIDHRILVYGIVTLILSAMCQYKMCSIDPPMCVYVYIFFNWHFRQRNGTRLSLSSMLCLVCLCVRLEMVLKVKIPVNETLWAFGAITIHICHFDWSEFMFIIRFSEPFTVSTWVWQYRVSANLR